MHLDEVAAAGALVQEVDVLGYNCLDETGLLEDGEREMGGVRLGLGQHRDPRLVEAPDLGGIGPESG